MANEVFEAVRTVLAVREYAERDVSGERFGTPLR
jgi:hypothetical protein